MLLALPYACGDVESEKLFDDALFVAFPGDQGENLPAMVSADQIDPAQMLMLEDGHCLKDHALAACNRPELRAGARMMGTSLHTLVQMVDNGLGLTLLPMLYTHGGIGKPVEPTQRRFTHSVDGKRSFRGTLTTVLPLIAFRRTRPVGSGCSGSGEVEGQQVVDISIDRALRQFGENVAQPCERLDA